MMTMLLGGLWHGASWRFVAWGGLHGLFLAGERLYRSMRPTPPADLAGPAGRPGVSGLGRIVGGLGPIVGMLITFALVNLTWVFFRAEDFTSAFHLISRMVGWAAGPSSGHLVRRSLALWIFGLTAVLLAGQWMARDTTLEGIASRIPWWARSVALASMIVLLIITSGTGEDNAFIYFQF